MSKLTPGLRGASRLAVAATRGLTDVVEAMHGGIARIPGTAARPHTTGITGLVYRSVRGVTGLVGNGLDRALHALEPLLDDDAPQPVSPRREALLAALNGVFGDHLAATGNPLAIAMCLRHEGRPLTAPPPGIGPRPLLLIHGLCMNDLQWRRDGADFATALAELGYTPLRLHYNTGLHISDNGRQLAELLEQLVTVWPGALQDLTLLGHSMGGLVARSAIHHAERAGMRWLARLRRLVTLGTPHLGAPLERGGQQLQQLLGLSAYARPLVALTERRSAGIQDLRFGALREADWGRRSDVPLPVGVDCYAIAATTGQNADRLPARLLGDGLVPLASALGRHREAARGLGIPPERRAVFTGIGHLQLQTDAKVLEQLIAWLTIASPRSSSQPAPPRSRALIRNRASPHRT